MTYDWSNAAARLLKSEIAREGITLADLAERLKSLGMDETTSSVKNKIWRGSFSASFLMQCLHVLGRQHVDLVGVVPSERSDVREAAEEQQA